MPSIDESKCVLITGATSGIGRALALDIANLPSCPVVIGTGRRKERLEEIRKTGINPIELSITSDFDALKRKVDEIVEKYPDVSFQGNVLRCQILQLSSINWTAGYGHT